MNWFVTCFALRRRRRVVDDNDGSRDLLIAHDHIIVLFLNGMSGMSQRLRTLSVPIPVEGYQKLRKEVSDGMFL